MERILTRVGEQNARRGVLVNPGGIKFLAFKLVTHYENEALRFINTSKV